MHTLTLTHFATYFCASLSILALSFAVGLGLYANLSLFLADSVDVITGYGTASIPRSEVQVVWELPAVFAFAAILWAMGALALHAV